MPLKHWSGKRGFRERLLGAFFNLSFLPDFLANALLLAWNGFSFVPLELASRYLEQLLLCADSLVSSRLQSLCALDDPVHQGSLPSQLQFGRYTWGCQERGFKSLLTELSLFSLFPFSTSSLSPSCLFSFPGYFLCKNWEVDCSPVMDWIISIPLPRFICWSPNCLCDYIWR